MLKGKILSKLCILGVSIYCLSSSTVFAFDFTKNNTPTPTDKITIFEQDDEKDGFSKFGFTRGDMSFLYDATFDSSQVENVTGDVMKVLRVQYPDQDCYLIAILTTKANNGKMVVNLGPVWFLEENGLAINEGDSIQVTGAKMRTNGRFLLLATEVTKNGKSLNLRDKDGTALWGSPKTQKGEADCMKIGLGRKQKFSSQSQ